MSDSNDIRAKRLARLAALNSSSERTTNENTPKQEQIPQVKEQPKQTQEVKVKNVNTGSEGKKAESAQNSKQEVEKSGERKRTEPKLSQEEDISCWLIDELDQIFHATIKSPPGSGLVYLRSLVEETGKNPLLLSEDSLESIFMEILTEEGVPSHFKIPINYLFSVYQNAFKVKRILSKKAPYYDVKIAILNKIIGFSASYGLIGFQVDDMFLNNDVRTALQAIISNDSMVPFLVDITLQAVEQGTLLDLLNIILPTLSATLYKLNLNDSGYSKYLSIFESLVNIKPVAAVFSQIDGFHPPDAKNSLDYEHKTILGSWLRLSPLLDDVANYYFSGDVSNISRVQLNSTYESLQNEYKVVIDRLFFITDKLVRGSPETRHALTKWFADFINLSHLRRGSHADPKTLPSDGIMFNISIILIRLSSPFLEYPTYSKLGKIDSDYFGKSSALQISEESRVNSSVQEADENYKDVEKGQTNFISDCFFLALTYLHYGIGGVFIRHDRLKQNIKQINERIEMVENNRIPAGANPMMLQFIKAQLPTLRKTHNQLQASKNSIQAIFSFRALQLSIFDFIVGATAFFTMLVDPKHQYPKTAIEIPLYKIQKVSELDSPDFLKTKTPLPWKFYPEYLIEGIINYCKFVVNFRGAPLVQNVEKLSLFVEFAVIVLRCPELVGNPHMKANLVELLFVGTLPMSDGSPGFISPIFHSNKLVMNNILYSLLDIYVTVEKTGASSQFYDKFNSRYYISVILEELWKSDIYRNQLTDYSKHNVDFFVRFIARMLNDTTYLLDETFNELNAIHNFQVEMKKRSQGIPENTDEFGTSEELENSLSSSERKAKSYMGLSHKTMELFKLFTKEVPQGFILPEIVDRLSSMLDYNLSVLVGPKCSNLKVEAPEKYDFDPRRTLKDLSEIYTNLADQDKFVKSTARDGRSFNITYFKKAEKILKTKTMIDAKILTKLDEFAEKAESQRLSDEGEELELGDIPDEYLDPLMFTLMEDPVILPASKMSIDRSTIKAHLLSDPTDPFNRMPLKLEDVTNDIELKQKIEEFKKSKRKDAAEDVEMADA